MKDEARRAELAHFLRSRRERFKPSQFSLPEGAKQRRTPGLRREELAQIAGISPIWYTKLEQERQIQESSHMTKASLLAPERYVQRAFPCIIRMKQSETGISQTRGFYIQWHT